MEQNHVVPPYSNRGAQNTNREGLIACVDWVQVTFLHVTNPYDIIHLLDLPEDDFTLIETGKFGYTSHLRNGNISIYFSEHRQDLHLEITGQGCRQYESYHANKEFLWSELFGIFLMTQVNFTRLDLAIDDFKGYFKIATLYRKLKSAHASSKFKSFRYMVKQKIAEKEITGQTVYLGSPDSRLMIRFYDKLAERLSKNFKIEDGLTCWNRTELQLRDERAKSAAVLISTEKYELGSMISGILKNYINFLNPTKNREGNIHTNKARWKVADFWTSFLGDVEKLQLTEKAPDKTIEQTKSWYDKNMTATMAMLFVAFDHDYDMIIKWLNEGKEKFSRKHETMLDQFRKEKERQKFNEHQKRVSRLGTTLGVNDNGQVIPINLSNKEKIEQIKNTFKNNIKKDPAQNEQNLND